MQRRSCVDQETNVVVQSTELLVQTLTSYNGPYHAKYEILTQLRCRCTYTALSVLNMLLCVRT
jgi:hypothetical protein